MALPLTIALPLAFNVPALQLFAAAPSMHDDKLAAVGLAAFVGEWRDPGPASLRLTQLPQLTCTLD